MHLNTNTSTLRFVKCKHKHLIFWSTEVQAQVPSILIPKLLNIILKEIILATSDSAHLIRKLNIWFFNQIAYLNCPDTKHVAKAVLCARYSPEGTSGVTAIDFVAERNVIIKTAHL